jgi:uncharacterized protein (DUF427 family)
MKATWNGEVIARSDETVVVEGNHYFPRSAVRRGVLQPSPRRTVCPWKSEANYLDVVVDGEVNPAAAWCYPDPSPAAAEIVGRVAFWRGVRVTADGDGGEGRHGLLARLLRRRRSARPQGRAARITSLR